MSSVVLLLGGGSAPATESLFSIVALLHDPQALARLNVWVEDGELLIYLARAGCYDENGALLKLGRVRVNL